MIKPLSQLFLGIFLLAVSTKAYLDFYTHDIIATFVFAFVILPLFGSVAIVGALNLIGVRNE